jgi:hypothetical protein
MAPMVTGTRNRLRQWAPMVIGTRNRLRLWAPMVTGTENRLRLWRAYGGRHGKRPAPIGVGDLENRDEG